MPAMRHLSTLSPARLYVLGQGLILLGAWLVEATGSLLPMALATSAGVMLSAPFVRERVARLKAARRR